MRGPAEGVVQLDPVYDPGQYDRRRQTYIINKAINWWRIQVHINRRGTPSKNDVGPDVLAGIREQGPEYQIVQVQAFHEYPGVVGRYEVLPQASD